MDLQKILLYHKLIYHGHNQTHLKNVWLPRYCPCNLFDIVEFSCLFFWYNVYKLVTNTHIFAQYQITILLKLFNLSCRAEYVKKVKVEVSALCKSFFYKLLTLSDMSSGSGRIYNLFSA